MVTPTSLSLLDRLKTAPPDDPDWEHFHAMYSPLIRRWIGRVPGMEAHVGDVTQDVLKVLLREIPAFERRRVGSFRAWLRQVTVNRVRTYCRRRDRQPRAVAEGTDLFLNQLADSDSPLARMFDQEHAKHICSKLLAAVKADFSEGTWAAFRKFALEERTAAEVAQELGMTVDLVVKAKSRVLRRLRQEAGSILD
jgi:RNA polymerase sigma-70 factor (ECF subfamily)